MVTPSQVSAAVKAAFDVECRELALEARLDVASERLVPSFEAQFGARADWLLLVFREELAARGEAVEPAWCARSAGESELARLLDVVRLALRRTRARMFEADSWVSGGVAWPFAVDDPIVRERGLALYRAPALAAATVKSGDGRATIAFPAGDCGEVVSAGIWIPTRLDGDFEFAASYQLPEWIAGERESCLGLYAVAPDGTFRMYAQRVARAGETARVVADVDGSAGPTVARCTGATGRLRIAREAGVLHAWHREHDAWSWLGRTGESVPRALLVGIKVWAVGYAGPLRAELFDFELAGRAAAEQTPPPPVRSDPRHST